MIGESIQRKEETDQEDTSASDLNAGKEKGRIEKPAVSAGGKETEGKGGGTGAGLLRKASRDEGSQNGALIKPRSALEVRCRGLWRPDPPQDGELCTGRDQCDSFSVGPLKSGFSVPAGVSRWAVIHLASWLHV
jgi:hypothetical protein